MLQMSKYRFIASLEYQIMNKSVGSRKGSGWEIGKND